MMQLQPFFSIILPAYNAELFLARTLTSIFSQDFSDYELLLVNDGSTDNTLDICKEFAAVYPQVKVIDKKNEGVAVARNAALQAAQGKYILFVDADDIFYPQALKKIYERLRESDVDYLRYEFQTIDSDDHPLFPNYEAHKRKECDGAICEGVKCIEKLVRREFFLWSSAFKREIIEKNHITFLEGCTYNEDTLFISQFLCSVQRGSYLDQVLYGYRKSDVAVTSRFTAKNLSDIMDVYGRLMSLADRKVKPLSTELKRTAQCLALHIYEEQSLAPDSEACRGIFNECMRSPLLFEWRMMAIFGHYAEFLWKIKVIIIKILRRL